MATKRSGKKGTADGNQTSASKKAGTGAPSSMPKGGKDPKGGLTAKGRAYFAEKEGSHLRPGVQGEADTPEKMLRKGSFLRRHFAHPRGPMKDDKGEPTRLALSAHAWGEEVPETMGDARKLADEGHALLEEYHTAKDAAGTEAKGAKRAGKKAAKRSAAKKQAGQRGAKTAAKKTATKKTAVKRPAKASLRGAESKG